MENERARIEVTLAPSVDAGHSMMREMHAKIEDKGQCVGCGEGGYRFYSTEGGSEFLCLDCVVMDPDVIRVVIS
jgi:hypothetical protein